MARWLGRAGVGNGGFAVGALPLLKRRFETLLSHQALTITKEIDLPHWGEEPSVECKVRQFQLTGSGSGVCLQHDFDKSRRSALNGIHPLAFLRQALLGLRFAKH